MIDIRQKSPGSLIVFSAASAAMLGRAIEINRGAYNPAAVPFLVAGVAFALAGWIVPVPRWRGVALALCLAGIVWQIWQHMCDIPMEGITSPLVYYHFCLVALPILALAAAGAILIPKWSRTFFIPLLLLAHFVTGIWLLHNTRRPFLDVYEETTDSCQALSKGVNPYAITFPDIYALMPAWDRMWLDAGTVANGRTNYGYQYMPLSLELEWTGQAFAGDFRLANLLALTLAGAFLAYAAKGPLAPAAASLLLLTPRGYYIIEQGWSEPAALLCMAAAVFAAMRKPSAAPWIFGLLIVSKQYMVLSLLAAPFLLPEPRTSRSFGKFFLKAAIAGAVVTLPLVLWNYRAFWHSAVFELAKNPFRGDALSLSALWFQAGHAAPPQWFAFAVAVAAGIFANFRAPRTPAGFAGTAALALICFFALAKQAFGNYYLLEIAALCSCVAAGSLA
jgi:hypothetical protein